MRTKTIANRFIKYLKGVKVQECMCDLCGHVIGHPLKYCPKCPGKMKMVVTSEYLYVLRKPDLAASSAYKFRCARLTDENKLTQKQWVKIVNEITKEV